MILHNFWIKEGATTETTELVSLQTPRGLPSTITEPHLMSSEDASKQASQPASVRKFKSSPESYFVTSDSRKCTARLLTAMRGKAEICWTPEREVDASCHMAYPPGLGTGVSRGSHGINGGGVLRSSREIPACAQPIDSMQAYITSCTKHKRSYCRPNGQK